jgi:hypothetical protein
MLLAMATVVLLGFSIIGCGPKPPNNNYDVETMITRLNPGGTTEVDAPLSAQPVAGQWLSNNPNGGLPISGTTTSFRGVTSTFNYSAGGVNLLRWPTTSFTSNLESPAYWNIEWSHPSYCLTAKGEKGDMIPIHNNCNCSAAGTSLVAMDGA